MMTETESITYNITVLNEGNYLKTLFNDLKKFNKKAKKYDAVPVMVEVGEPYMREFEIPTTVLDVWAKAISGIDTFKTKTVKREVVDITIDYVPITVAGGWKVLGSVERMADSEWNIIHGNMEDIQDYKKIDFSFCDHCNTKRNRKKVIILENPEGERKVVGRQCVKDYLGISIAHAIFSVDYPSMIQKMFEMFDVDFLDDEYERGGNGMRLDYGVPLEAMASIVVAILRKDRWTYKSAKYCEYEGGDTPNIVMNTYYAIKDKHCEVTFDEIVSEDDIKLAQEILDELKEEYPEERIKDLDNSFEYDLAVMLHAGHVVKEKYFVGMFGYRVSKRMATKTQKHDPQKSKYYGSIGDKIKGVDIEITRTRECESYYGVSLMVCGYFKDTDDQFVTFCSGDTDFLYKDDDSIKEYVKINATIKDHQDRGYGKQTVLKLVKEAK
jgi:hypothetical protein